VLLSPDEHVRAQALLAEMGFRRVVRDYEQGRRIEHDSPWALDGVASVDLHLTLPRVRGVSPEAVWRALWPHTVERDLPAGGQRVRVLDEPAAALLVGLHAAHHSGYDELELKPLEDLRRAVDRVPVSVWREAATLARTLRAEPQLSRGLHTVASGAELARTLGLADPSSERNQAAGFERLAATRDRRERARMLARALVPSPSYLRWSSRLARRGRRGLVAAYVLRPFVLAAHAPWGYVVWRRARRRPAATR
jgi:hypothetical protein